MNLPSPYRTDPNSLINLARKSIVSVIALTALFAFCNPADAQLKTEPHWYPYTFARPADRAVIQSLPVESRPYRPLHIYGNLMRRDHHRGTPLPQPRDIVITARSIFVVRR